MHEKDYAAKRYLKDIARLEEMARSRPGEFRALYAKLLDEAQALMVSGRQEEMNDLLQRMKAVMERVTSTT